VRPSGKWLRAVSLCVWLSFALFPSLEENLQVARQGIHYADQVRLLHLLYSCGGQLTERNSFQEKGGLLRREFCPFLDPLDDILVLGADPLTVKAPHQAVVPGRVQPFRERQVGPLVVARDAPARIYQETVR
jgi:hypothetical protein